jgi:hypothetical protein
MKYRIYFDEVGNPDLEAKYDRQEGRYFGKKFL